MLVSEGRQFEIVIERNYLPAAIAAVIKAAHLTMFGLFGYEWVFSAAGLDLAQILRRFYLAHRETPKAEIEGPLREYFSRYAQMVKPFIGVDPALLGGTVNDNRIVEFTDNEDQPFVVGIVVRAGNSTSSVLVSAGDGTTYCSFIKCPPTSVALHILEWKDGKCERISSHRVPFKPNHSQTTNR